MRKGLKKNKKGFTLVELIIVIAILAILAAVAVPSFIGLQNEAVRGKNVGNASAIVMSVNAYNAMYPNSIIKALDAASIKTLSDLKLWPAGMTAEDQTAALTFVTISADGVATNKGATASAPPAAG